MMGGGGVNSTLCPPQAGPTGTPVGPGSERAEGGGGRRRRWRPIASRRPPLPSSVDCCLPTGRSPSLSSSLSSLPPLSSSPLRARRGMQDDKDQYRVSSYYYITKKMGCCCNFGLVCPLLLGRGYTNKKKPLSRPPSGCPRGWGEAVSRRIRYLVSEFGARVSLLATGSCGRNRHKEINCTSFRSTSKVER
jgi:hypothetical protein